MKLIKILSLAFFVFGIAGYAIAQYRVGLAHLEGKGTSKDNALAAIWLEKAKKQNHADAAHLLDLLQAGKT